MGEPKHFLNQSATNKMMWVTLIIGVIIIVSTVGAVFGISYIRNRSELANADTQEPEDSIKQEDLVDTSKMSEEELKKLNEEEAKKAKQKEEEENKKKGKTTPTKNKYYIKINYGAQVVTIYTYDKNGKYTVPVRACVCSTGAATPTSGVYRLAWKARWGRLFGNVWGQYCSQVVGDILIHSVPYNQARNDTLVSTYYDRLGRKDSMGCIRLTTIDAQWIYYNCPSGTQIEFYSSSNPGPLGKPVAKKVSSAPGNLKHWDPTDPDPRNPWKTYKPAENNTNNNTTSNNTTNDVTNNTINNNEQNNNTVNNNEQNNNNTVSNSEQNNNNTVNNSTENNNTVDNSQTTNPGQNTNTQSPSTGGNGTQSGTTTPTDPKDPVTPKDPVVPDTTKDPVTPTEPIDQTTSTD